MSRARCSTTLGLAFLVLASVCGCTPPLLQHRSEVPALQLAVVGQPSVQDGRARFREIYCTLAASTQSAPCEELLVRLADEPPAPAAATALPAPDPGLHILFIPGAFGECFGTIAPPFAKAFAQLTSLGYHVRVVTVSGRSSSEHNARQIAAAVNEEELATGEKLVLVGYSKGAPDILEFLATNPELAQKVDAVVGIGAAVNGSPIADAYESAYAIAATIDARACDAGDGGVISSLSREQRLTWLATHTLPTDVRYFSMGSASRPEQTARLMRFTKRKLSRMEPLNDGQMIVYDQLIPGSTLLGYADGDHWAVVLPLQERWPRLGGNPAGIHYPRDLLFEAIVLYVGEALK